MKDLRSCFLLMLLLTAILGGGYTAVVAALGWTLFPNLAAGSLIVKSGIVIGSSLLGQPFTGSDYFWGRPSATTPFPYNAGASSGANLAPSNPALLDRVASKVAELQGAHGEGPIPLDLVTASGSGLDPNISIAAAEYQAERVARARKLSISKVRSLIETATHYRTFAILGEPVVNVLELNLSLDAISKASP